MKCSLSTSCLILLCVIEAAAQIELRGRLISSTTKAPIYQGSVIVLGTELEGTSNENGEFTIFLNKTPAGDRLTIMASAYQFESTVLEFPLAGTSFNTVREIELVRYIRQPVSESRPAFRVSGRVVDERGEGIPDIRITAANIHGYAVTTAYGQFDFLVDQIRPIHQTELWFSKWGCITKRQFIQHLQQKQYAVALDTAIVIRKSSAEPSKSFTISFVDANDRPLAGVAVWVDNKFVGVTDLLGSLRLTLGEKLRKKTSRVHYYFKPSKREGGKVIEDETVIRNNAANNLIKIQLYSSTPKLLVKTYKPPNIPLPDVEVRINAENIKGKTDSSGQLLLEPKNMRGELLLSRAEFYETKKTFEITKATRDSIIEIILNPKLPETIKITVLQSDNKDKPVPEANVTLGKSIMVTNDSGVVVFRNPKSRIQISVTAKGFESKQLLLDKELELPEYKIWLTQELTTLRATVIDSIVTTSAVGDTTGLGARLSKDFKGSPESDTSTHDPISNVLSNKLINFFRNRIYIGIARWQFDMKNTLVSPEEDNGGIGLLMGAHIIERAFHRAINLPESIPVEPIIRTHLFLEGRLNESASFDLINFDSGIDFLLRVSILQPHIGLRARVHDYPIAKNRTLWLLGGFYSYGSDIKLLKRRRVKLSLDIRFSIDERVGEYYSVVNQKSENLGTPRAKKSLSIIIKTKWGTIQASRSWLSPGISTKTRRLENISNFIIAYSVKH